MYLHVICDNQNQSARRVLHLDWSFTSNFTHLYLPLDPSQEAECGHVETSVPSNRVLHGGDECLPFLQGMVLLNGDPVL